MSSISFDNPYLLLIAIPLAVLLAVPFFIAVKKENVNGHNIASAVIHLIIAITVAFAFAGTKVETTVTKTDVYIVADLSYSSSKNFDLIDDYIEEIKDNLPRNSKLGVVCFAKDQQLYVPIGGKLKSVKNADIDYLDNSETDIEAALDYTGTLFRDSVIKRIVLISDGKQTHLSDANALKRSVDSLRAEGIFVDAVFLDNNNSEDTKEVQIASVDVTQNTYLNKTERVDITLRSTFDCPAKISLSKNGVVIASVSKRITAGYYNFNDFLLDTSIQGTFDYEVIVEAEGDENQKNNSIGFTQNVSGALNVLLVTESEGDRLDIEGMYSGHATVKSVNPEQELPCSIEELCKYDEIIISNADITKSRDYLLFLDNVDTAVSLFGKSLITLGNNYIHEKEELKPLEDILPIRYGNVDRDAKLYTLVVDASRSMETLSKFNIAKSAAKQLINTLNEGDNVCIVSFNGNYHTEFSPDVISDTPIAGEKNSTREKALMAIDSISAEHGTVISFGLEQALELIKDLDYGEKQIMLLTDGLTVENTGTSVNEDKRIEAVLQEFAKNRIAVSVIDLGRGSDTSVTANNAEKRLKNVAALTSGKYVLITSESELQNVMFEEGLIDDITDVVIDEEVYVYEVRSTDEVLNDVGIVSSVDYVTGFIYNKAKSSTTTVLGVLYEGAVDRYVPLYSYWTYGNGKVSTLTCSPEQTDVWLSQSRERFFTNALTTNIPDEKNDYPFVVDMYEENGFINIAVTPAKVDSTATLNITIGLPDSEEKTTEQMTFANSGYSYRFSTDNVGKYTIEILYKTPTTAGYTVNLTYYVPFLPEYDSFVAYDISVLHKMIGSEGTVFNGTNEVIKIENDESLISSYILDLTITLLTISISLFVIDVIIRKLKWEDILSLFGKRKK